MSEQNLCWSDTLSDQLVKIIICTVCVMCALCVCVCVMWVCVVSMCVVSVSMCVQVFSSLCSVCYSHWFSPSRSSSPFYCTRSSYPNSWNNSDISYLIEQPGCEHSDPVQCSPGSCNSQLASCSVGITSSCLLLAFPLSVSPTLSCLCCLCSSVLEHIDYSQ